MLFASYSFIAFLGVLFLAYYLVPKRLQWILLLIADIVFYWCAGISGLIFMAVTVVSSWFFANQIQNSFMNQKAFLRSEEGKLLSREEKKVYKQKKESVRKVYLILALLVDLGILAVLKYTNFVLSNLGAIFRFEASVSLILPMGISFYTFQTVGYIIDVYWEKVDAEKNLAKTALFTSFFPLLVQGPISRYGDLKESLFGEHPFDSKQVGFGVQRIIWGYFKKLVIADRILPAVTAICGDPVNNNGAFSFFGAVFYAIQLYADFTGGIDITIGIAQVFGVSLKENFMRPFFSRNIAEYWRRWHISMGTWFKDYIFYPLSVSPKLLKISKTARSKISDGFGKKLPVYVSTIVTWFVTGLWHGAAWNFIVWGLLNAVIILAAEEFKPVSQKFRSRFAGLTASFGYRIFETLRTFLMMCALRMLDCYRNVAVTFKAFASIFTAGKWVEAFRGGLLKFGVSSTDYVIIAFGVLLMFGVSLYQENRGSVREAIATREGLSYLVFGILLLLILVFGAYGVGYDASQFIYNQF